MKDEAIDDFARAYGSEGEWVALFRRYRGYTGTTLLQDTRRASRFVTIDRWETPEDYAAMRAQTAAEYARLDSKFAEWTDVEREVGVFVARSS